MRRYEVGQEVVSGVKIISHIGAGGFGTVYKVSVPGGVEKALKIINLQGTQGVKEYNALKLIKKISHPNLVSIDSYWLRDLQGKLIDFSSDDSINAEKQSLELIILMGLGRMSLHDMLMQYLNQGKPGIPFDELIRLMSATAEAIDYLNEPHDLGLKEPVAIQHGDIKPGNILLVGNSVQVCDYGLAKAITTSKGARTSIALFSPGYCSPEMNRNQPSYWSDQFSLAISYYELRTGKLPFNEDEEINAGIVAALGKLDFSGVPKAEREVLLKAANPIPNQRYPKCMDLINALRATAYSSPRDSGPKPRTLEEVLQPESDIVPGYKLVSRISQGERDEFWKAITPAGKPFIIHVIREFRGALGNQLLQSLEFLRQLDEHENLINLRDSWTLHSDGREMPYIDAGSLGNQAVALVSRLDNVDCTLEDYYNECLKKRVSQGIPDHELLQFMMQAGKAVDYLTQLGHYEYLDLKPQTILLTKNKTVKLGIAGLAKRLMSGSSSLTTDRLVNAFAPPELFGFEVGKTQHWNSNQYSLALTYYWLRSLGHLPFPADSTPKQIREYHLHGQLDFSDVPEREQNILYNATMLDPNQRFANCFEFVDAMQVAMGVSVPQYASVAPLPKIPPRPTPMKVEQAPTPQSNQGERPTEHVERQQRITPPVIRQQKTPQSSPSRRSDPYSTINSMPVLPQGFGYDETTEHRPFQAAHDMAPLMGLTPVDPPAPQEQEEETAPDYRTVIRQTSDEKNRKRRRTRIIMGFAGMFIMGVIGLVAAYRFGLLPNFGRGIAEATTTGSDPEKPTPVKPTQSKTSPVLASLDKLEKDIAKQLSAEQPDYVVIWDLIKQAKEPAWEKVQQERVRQRLGERIQNLLAKEQFDPATREVNELATKYRDNLPSSWKEEQLTKIKNGKDAKWSVKWAGVKDQLRGLDSPKKISDFQTQLQKLAAEVPEENSAGNQEAKELLDSVKVFIKLVETPLKSDPITLNAYIESFNAWKDKASLDFQASYCAKAIPGEVLKKAKESFQKVSTRDELLKHASLLDKAQKLADTEDDVDWITAGRLELAAQQYPNVSKEAKKEASGYRPQTLKGHYAKAACLSQEMSPDAMNRWRIVYPPNNMVPDRELEITFRKELAEKCIKGLLDQCRGPEAERGVFLKEKLKIALDAVNLLLMLKGQKNDEPVLLAEKAILEDIYNPASGSLEAFQLLPIHKELPAGLRKIIQARILKRVLPENASITAKIDQARLLLDAYYGKQGITEDDLISRIIIGMNIPDIMSRENEIPTSHRGKLASILSELAENIVFGKKEWESKLETKKLSINITQTMLQTAKRMQPDNNMHYLRLVYSQYDRWNDELLDKWNEYIKSMDKNNRNDFSSHLVHGIVLYMSEKSEGTDLRKRARLISQLEDADSRYAKANEMLTTVSTNNKLKYQFQIALDRSNIATRMANLQFKNELQKKYLTFAIDFAKAALLLDKDNAEALDSYGIILEDHAYLLGDVSRYSEAISAYSDAIGILGESWRNKPLLHRGRSYYRWAKDTKLSADYDPSGYDKALSDLNRFLNNKIDHVNYEIEARYFRSLCFFEKASQFSKDAPEYAELVAKGLTDLRITIELINAKSNDLWRSKVSYEYLQRLLNELQAIVKNKEYDKYSGDDVYKNIINQLRYLEVVNSKNAALAKYISSLISEVDGADYEKSTQMAFEGFAKSIEIAKDGDEPDIEVIKRALTSRLVILNKRKDYLAYYEDAKYGYDICTKYNLSPGERYDFLQKICNSSFAYYDKTKNQKYWSIARDNLLEMFRYFPQLIDDKRYPDTVVRVINQSQAEFRDRNINETLASLDLLCAKASPEFLDKCTAIVAQVRSHLKNQK